LWNVHLVRIIFVDQWRAYCEYLLEYWWRDYCERILLVWISWAWLNIYYEEEREEEDLMDASKFQKYQRSWWKNSRNFRDPSFLCIHELSVYRVCIHWGIRGLAMYRANMYAGCLKIGSVWWTEWWRLVLELVPSSWMMRQVPDFHFMSSDLSLRHWYGYIIILMDTIVLCVVNS